MSAAADLRLPDEEVDNYQNAPYYKIGVLFNSSEYKVYVDTQTLEMLFGPPIYSGSWQSNQSVVIKMDPHTIQGGNIRYSFQNVIIPNRYLEIAALSSAEKLESVNTPGIQLEVEFQSTNLVLFQRHSANPRSQVFAFSFEAGGHTFYLKPAEVPIYDSQGTVESYQKAIVSVMDTSPASYYYFVVNPTTYPN